MQKLFRKICVPPIIVSVTVIFLLCIWANLSSCNKQKNATPLSQDIDSIIVYADKFKFKSPYKTKEYLYENIAEQKLSFQNQIKFYAYLFDLYYNFSDSVDVANVYADSLLNYLDLHSNKAKETDWATAYFLKGDALQKKGHYSEAYAYFYNGRKLGIQSLDNCTRSEYNYRIGMTLYKQERYHDAAKNFKKSYLEGLSCNMTYTRYYKIQETINNTALSYYKCNMLDSAYYFYNEALLFINKNQHLAPEFRSSHEIAKAVIYGNLAQIFIVKNQLDTAQLLLNKSIAINSLPSGDKYDKQFSQLKLANLYLLKNKPDSAGFLLNTIAKSFDSLNNKAALLELNRLYAKYYEAQNNIASAHKNLIEYVQLADSLRLASKNLVAFDVGKEVTMLEALHDRDTLKKNNELQKLYITITIVIIVFIVLILIIIFRRYQKDYATLLQLQKLNEQISTQKQALEKAYDTLEQNSQEKDRILWLVSHDLRSPITTIEALSALIIRENPSKEIGEIMSLIKASSKNSLHLINEILETAGLIQKQAIVYEPVKINELIAETVAMLNVKAVEKEQIFDIIYLEYEQTFMGNKEMMWRVLSNLISNALKFSYNKSIIHIKATTNQTHVLFTISDNGIGIPAELQEKVFDMFSSAKRKGTSGEKAFGLGLSICKGIVSLHQGKIWFNSEINKGTTFFIQIPLVNS